MRSNGLLFIAFTLFLIIVTATPVFAKKRKKKAVPKPGFLWQLPVTPNQPPPGDSSYVSASCRKPVAAGQDYDGISNPQISKSLLPAWNKKHFTEDDLSLISQAVRNLLVSSTCPFQTKECISYHSPGLNLPNVPNIPLHSLGTCALVALGDVLHRKPYGSEIDAHDTVFRIGTPPVSHFTNHTGSKVDATFYHHNTRLVQLPIAYQHVRFLIVKSARQHINIPPHDGATILYFSPDFDEKFREVVVGMYENYTDPVRRERTKPRHASTGFPMVLALAFSGLCSRLDLYGFSPYHNRHYYCEGEGTRFHTHDPRGDWSTCRPFKDVHSPALENWFYHFLMSRHPDVNLCVYL